MGRTGELRGLGRGWAWRKLPLRLGKLGFALLMLTGWFFIGEASLPYFDPEVVAPFVLEKLPVRFEALWMKALEVHVATALVTFPLCLLLATRWLQRRRLWHRWLGRVTGALVVTALVPSGAILAFEAKGGVLGTVGFLLSGVIIFVAMVRGVVAVRRGDQLTHAYAMRHVVAQMSVAVTSRAMLVAFDIAQFNQENAYLVALWVPVLGSAAFVELTSKRRRSSASPVVLSPSRSHP